MFIKIVFLISDTEETHAQERVGIDEPQDSAEINIIEEQSLETTTDVESSETVTEDIAPSAPCFEDLEQPQTDQPLQKLLYPNVHMLQSIDLDGIKATKQRIILQPFTYEQLKELYNNPELLMAEAFETEFIIRCTS